MLTILSLALAGSLSHYFFHHKYGKKVFLWGSLATVFPEVDSLIYIPNSPGLNLVVKNAFTHSFLLSPLFALFLSLIIFRWNKKRGIKFCFFDLTMISMIGIAVRLLLDLLASSGTAVLWPLSFKRYSLDLIPSFDLLLLIPIIFFTGLTLVKKNIRFNFFVWGIFLFYLFFAFLQQNQAYTEQSKLILKRGELVAKKRVFPLGDSIFSWRSLTRTSEKIYYDKIVCFPLVVPSVRVEGQLLLAKKDQLLTTYLNKENIESNFENFSKYADGFISFLQTKDADFQIVADVRHSLDLENFGGQLQMKINRAKSLSPVRIEHGKQYE